MDLVSESNISLIHHILTNPNGVVSHYISQSAKQTARSGQVRNQ